MTRVTRSFIRQEISPLAGRKIPFLFTKHLYAVQMFCEQEQKRTMLPQASRAVYPGTCLMCLPTAYVVAFTVFIT